MTIKEKAKELAFAELEEFMDGCNYTNRKAALYDYLAEFYACAGFDDAFGEKAFSGASEEDLLHSFFSIFMD